MSYIQTAYKNDTDLAYPRKLVRYLYNNHYSKSAWRHLVLDVCPGNFKQVDAFKEIEGVEVETVDIEDSPRLDFLVTAIDKPWQLENQQYGSILLKSVIEHVHNPLVLLENCRKHMTSQGRLVILAPEWKSNIKLFYDDPTHVHPYTVVSMYKLIEMHGGFNIEACELFTQLPFYWNRPWLRPLVWFLSKFRFIKSKLTRFAHDKMILTVLTKNDQQDKSNHTSESRIKEIPKEKPTIVGLYR